MTSEDKRAIDRRESELEREFIAERTGLDSAAQERAYELGKKHGAILARLIQEAQERWNRA